MHIEGFSRAYSVKGTEIARKISSIETEYVQYGEHMILEKAEYLPESDLSFSFQNKGMID